MEDFRKAIVVYRKSVREAITEAWERFCTTEKYHFCKIKKKQLLVTLVTKYWLPNIPSFGTLQIRCQNPSRPWVCEASLKVLCFKTSHKSLFGPSSQQTSTFPYPVNASEHSFTYSELCRTFYAFNKDKTPGPHNIDHNTLRELLRRIPITVLELYNTFLHLNYFQKDC